MYFGVGPDPKIPGQRRKMRSKLKAIRAFFIKVYRIIWNAACAFVRNEDSLKASALTFYTLISIVPFLAVAYGIATGFGFEQYFEDELKLAFDEQPEVIDYAIKFARSTLQNAKGSVIAGVGLFALFWTNISMLSNIEGALNEIWRVRQPRSWAKKLTDYLAVMIICPIFFVVSSSLSLYLITRFAETAKENRIVEWFSPYIFLLFKVVPFFLSALLFVVIYLFIPNTKVQARPRIIAGIIAGIAFQLWQWVYIKFQVEISSYGAIYGTFAALPLFLIWVQVSWLIVLGGAEIAAQIENEISYGQRDMSHRLLKVSQKQLGLLILHRCIQAYSHGNPPLTTLKIAQDLGIPLMTAQQMIDILEDGEVLVEVGSRGDPTIGYQPSRDARLFTIKGVCDAIEQQIGWTIAVEDTPVLELISECLQELDRLADESPANHNMQEIASI